MKAPFPWFGGKSAVADIVWDRFGNVPNYVEPFAGSLSVLLNRPHDPGTETVNDKDAYLVNFWRAISSDPVAVAKFADWPVSECDLIARHRWLVTIGVPRLEMMRADPDYFDAKVAGWWVWGLCSWIGSGWCVQRGDMDPPQQLPHLGDAGVGINRKLPHLGNAGRGELIAEYFRSLSERIRNVRICCGDWDRVLGESVTVKHGLTGVFLDPPYDSDEHSITYSANLNISNLNISKDVCGWAIANGDNPALRIALCGYEGEHSMPESWECIAWKARGGYGSQGKGCGRNNSRRERIWFSPNCLIPQESLFSQQEAK